MRKSCATKTLEASHIHKLALAFAFILVSVSPASFGREKKTLTLTSSQTRGADAQLDASAATTNFGTATSLNVAARTGTGQASRGVIQFDLTSFPNVAVKQADMSLTVTSGGNKNGSYEAHRITSLWTESAVTWNNRVASTPWTAAGGDFSATITAATTINAGATGTFTWGLTADVQTWYTGTQNFGHLLLEIPSNGNDPAGINFNSREATSNQPQLALTFLQQVSNLKATAGNGSVSLTWTNPTTLNGSTSLEGYAGVLILRQVDKPVSATSIPTDGTTYSACSTIGTSNDVVVFVDSSSATSFTDNGVCSALSNDHVYSYKVFAVDTTHFYSTECSTVSSGSGACSANASAIVPEVAAVPSATAQSQAVWVFNTLAGSLSAPGVNPSASIVSGSNTLLFDINPQTGIPVAPPVSVGGAISGRPTLIDSLDDSIAQNVAYVPAQDNFIYAVNTDTGALSWLVNPASVPFVASAGIQAKAFSTSSYTLAQDIVVLGTHNGATTSANKFIALNANTGATVWTYTGGVTGGLLALDVVNAPPAIDYVHNAIWFTSRNGSLVLPQSLWKLNPNTGAVLFSANLGASDYSPSLTPGSDVLFVSITGGALTAIDPVSGSTLGSVNPGDGGLRSTAAVVTQNTPYTVVFSTSTKVWAYVFSCATNPCTAGGGTFTLLWGGTSVSNPSAPLAFVGLNKVYVGGGDGKIHELDLATGVDGKQRLLNPTATVGDVGIDVTLNYVVASASDGRIYAFAFPF